MLANRLQFASVCGKIQLKEARLMARTANVFVRVEPEIKEQAESVLDQKPSHWHMVLLQKSSLIKRLEEVWLM